MSAMRTALVRLSAFAVTAIVLLAAADETHADPVLVGDEIVIHSDLPRFDLGARVDVARSATGGFVAVWLEFASEGGIFGRLFDASGEPRGERFVIEACNSDEGCHGNVGAPTVAMDAAGNFVVAWLDRRDRTAPVFRRFAADGTPLGEAQRASLLPALLGINLGHVILAGEGPTSISLAMNPDGDFVVSWGREGTIVVRGETPIFVLEGPGTLYVRPFHADGTPKGLPALVSQDILSALPLLAMDDDGGFVIVWRRPADRRIDSATVQIRRYDANAEALGPSEPIAASNAEPSSLGMDAAGNFVALWTRGRPIGVQGGEGQRFDAEGTPVGDMFQPTNESNEAPQVAMAPTGHFGVTWSRAQFDGAGTFVSNDVYLRCYAADGTPQGEAIAVNDTPMEGGNVLRTVQPTLAYDGFGDLIVAYHQRTEHPRILARRVSGC